VSDDGAPVRRRGPWRAFAFAGAGAFIIGLALLVARPRVDPPAAAPYRGVRGASRGRAAGLQISYLRGGELRALEPGTALRAGDALQFVMRGERPRYLVVQLRDAGEVTATVFPSGGTKAVLVSPGQTLPVTPVVGAGLGNALVTALFDDRPFQVGAMPGPETETVTVQIEKAR
jgi:hypothetical protein